MQFNLPTTKTEMYTILNDLFYYYRTKRGGYEGTTLVPLELERLAYEKPSSASLKTKAGTLVKAEQERELAEKKRAIESEISKNQLQISTAQADADKLVAETRELYAESIQKVEDQAVKNGLIYTDAVLDTTAELENKMNAQIIAINTQKTEKVSTLNAIISGLQTELANVESYYAEVHTADVDKKFEELNDECESIKREVFKYNNSLDEKEQRYKNTIAQANANLELKFLEISSGEYTKDQLVEMGYYEDVITCVCGYYDTLEALTAYQDINRDKKVPIYLDDYYANIVYMYKSRADV